MNGQVVLEKPGWHSRSGTASGPPTTRFQQLDSQGPPVRAHEHTAPGTALWYVTSLVVVAVLAVVAVVSTFGIAILVALIGFLISFFTRKRVVARLRGNHVQISEHQLPEIHSCVQTYASRVSLSAVPDIYIVEASEINAVAFKLFARKFILISDDVLWGAVHAGVPDAIRFILAHEIAHHALGHTGIFRGNLASACRPLARLDELSADRVALQLLGERDAAYAGLLMLTVGSQLYPYINRNAVLQQALDVGQDKLSKKSEAGLSHPLLLRRLFELRSSPMK